MMRAVAALLALSLMGGCSSVTQTVGGWWDDWFGSVNPKSLPVPLVDFKPSATVRVSSKASVGGAGGSVFVPVVAQGGVFSANYDGKVYRLDENTLAEVWRADTGRKLSGGVGVGEGLVVVGSPKGDVLAYDMSGQAKWQAKVTSEVLAPPVIASGLVIVRTGDGRIHALDAKDGQRKWLYQRATPALTVRSFAGAAVDRNGVFAGFGGGKLVAIDINNGGIGWEASVALPRGVSELERIADVTSNPQIDGRMVCAAAFQGRVACFDIQSGNLLWARELSSLAGLTVDTRSVYVSDAKGAVHALDKTSGAYLWKQDKLTNRQLSAPLTYRGYIVVGDLQGYVHFLSREDGSFAARVATDGSPIRAQPVLLSDSVLVQTKNGGVFTLRLD